MRRTMSATAAVVGLASALGLASARGADLTASSPAPAPEKPASACGSHGTTLEFVSSPSEAARQALKEEKLVFVLHLSGIFEDPGLT